MRRRIVYKTFDGTEAYVCIKQDNGNMCTITTRLCATVLSEATVGLPRKKASFLERGFRFSDNCMKKFKPRVNFTRIGLADKEYAVVRLCKTVLSEALVDLARTKAFQR